MQQVELGSIFNDLKSDVSKSPKISTKTVADRANMANLAALDMLAETVADKNPENFVAKARALRNLSNELSDITGIVERLSGHSSKN